MRVDTTEMEGDGAAGDPELSRKCAGHCVLISEWLTGGDARRRGFRRKSDKALRGLSVQLASWRSSGLRTREETRESTSFADWFSRPFQVCGRKP